MTSCQLGALLTGTPAALNEAYAVTLISTSLAADAPSGWFMPMWQKTGAYVGPMLVGGIPLGLAVGGMSDFMVLANIRQFNSPGWPAHAL